MNDPFAKHIRAPEGSRDDTSAGHVRPSEQAVTERESGGDGGVADASTPSLRPQPAPDGARALASLVPLVVAAILIGLIGLGVHLWGGTAVTTAPTAQGPPDSVRIPALQAQSEELRGITLGKPVDATRLPREDLGALIKEISEREPDPSTSKGADDALHLLGALTAEQSLEEIITKGLEGQVAGLYDPKTDRLYLIRTQGIDATDSTIVHEIVHALQDHRYDLDRLIKPNPADADGQTAAQSVAEGDATEVQTRYIQQAGLAAALEEVAGAANQVSGAPADQLVLPTFLQRSMEFPYMAGAEFVRAVRAQGGEAAVDRAFRRPPRSTLAIMKPELYLSGNDAPEQVPVPMLAQGADRVFNTTFGAVDVLALTGDRDLAETWRGGRIVVDRRGEAGSMHLAIVSTRPQVLAAALRSELPAGARVITSGRMVVATNTQTLD